MSEALSTATSERLDPLAFVQNPSPEALQAALAEGNLAKLTAPQRLQFLAAVCQSVGLNPMTQPFEFISFQGKIRLYVKRDATDQLRKMHNVSITIAGRERQGDIFIVTARAQMADGRTDESIGVVSLKVWKDGEGGNAGRFVELSGDQLAIALMRAETKAKRRVTLSICGLGFMDESEVPEVQRSEEHEQRLAQWGGQTGPIRPEAEGMETAPATKDATPPRHWSDLLIEDAYKLVTFTSGKWAGMALWEIQKAQQFEQAFKEMPRDLEAGDSVERLALDALYFTKLRTRWQKKGYDEDETNAALRKSGFLKPCDGCPLPEMRDIPGELLMELGTQITDLPDLSK